ncbi:hypothetical protein HU200_001844 [Digitaria exilis]|uniref:Homeobox domain-containing protein n=1 Tax=Digitaria exilis TaxID=1010633 RepID=A0A835FZ78_9POAL|nr:hypothetical protein HU200_001844 [Digitaria exilis]
MEGGPPELYGLHADMEFLGMRGLATMAPGAAHHGHSKAAVLDDDNGGGSTMQFLSAAGHQQQQPSHQAPLSLSLCGHDGGAVTTTLHEHLGGSSARHHQQQQAAAWMMQHEYTATPTQGLHAGAWHLRSSRFLVPTQQLLHDFCSLPVDDSKRAKASATTTKQLSSQQQEEGGEGSSASCAPSPQIQAMDALELQRLKDKLYIMLEESSRVASRDDDCKLLHWQFVVTVSLYPSDVDKHILARQTGLSRSQVSNWFINARVRLWKPMVEEMYVEEMKEDGGGGGGQHQGVNPNPSSSHASEAHGEAAPDHGVDNNGGGVDRKPTRAQLMHDAGSLASVVNIGGVSRLENLGIMDHLDFDAYGGGGGQQGFGGVSLTLGLQQHDSHDGGGVNIAFGAPPPPSHHHHHGYGLFAAAPGHQQMDGGGGAHPAGHQHVQFGAAAGIVDGDAPPDAGQEHYRSLQGAGFHLLRDLAG